MNAPPAIRKTKVQALFPLLFIAAALCCCPFLFSAPGTWLITLIEKTFLHREINHERWLSFLFRAAFGECVLSTGLFLFYKKHPSITSLFRYAAGIAVFLAASLVYIATCMPLEGVEDVPPKPSLSAAGLLDGSFQEKFEKYFSYSFLARVSMTRLYNQILYTFFNSTDSKAVHIGKDNYLYEPPYLAAYFEKTDSRQERLLKEKTRTLRELKIMLEKAGKSFVLLITPSKASIYPEKLPSRYAPYITQKNENAYGKNFYDVFCGLREETGLDCLDLHEVFLKEKDAGKIIFARGGTHWSGSAMAVFLPAFTQYINRELNPRIGSIVVKNETILYNKPFLEDGDLEDLLNLTLPRYNFPSPHIETISAPSDFRPRAFVCGGSFNREWLLTVFGINGSNQGGTVFSSVDFSWYNTHIERYPAETAIAETSDDFPAILENDLIIIEINEQGLYPGAPQFVFAENLLNYLHSKEIKGDA